MEEDFGEEIGGDEEGIEVEEEAAGVVSVAVLEVTEVVGDLETEVVGDLEAVEGTEVEAVEGTEGVVGEVSTEHDYNMVCCVPVSETL